MFSFAGAARVLLKALPGARAVRSLFVRDRDGTVAYLDEVQAAVSAAAAADALTVHRAGSETVTGAKAFTALMDTDARRYFPQTAANDSLRFRFLENLAGFHNNTSTATGTLVIRLPNASPNVFFNLRFRLWEYSGRGITTVEACGYVRSTLVLDNTGASSTDVVRVRYVRFARDPAGYWCILLSNFATHTASTWGYPQGFIESIQLGWAGSNDAAWNDPAQYTVAFITDETGYTVHATADMQGQVGAAVGYNDALNAYMLNGVQASGFAAAAHNHAPADVAGTAVITTDSRLSDARTPLAHGHAAATTSVDGFLSAADKTKLNGLANYTLPMASATVLGGVKVGSGLAIDAGGVLSASGGGGGSAWWGKISDPTPIAITGTATATAGRMHYVSGSSDYDITLPDPQEETAVIGFFVDEDATGSFTLATNSPGYGVAEKYALKLTKGCVVLLMEDGVNSRWKLLEFQPSRRGAQSSVALGATVTAPSSATLVRSWKRVGDDMLVSYFFQGMAANAGSGVYLLPLPIAYQGAFAGEALNTMTEYGLSAVITNIGECDVGGGSIGIRSTANRGVCRLHLYSSTHLIMSIVNGAGESLWGSSSFPVYGGGGTLCMRAEARIPMAGW